MQVGQEAFQEPDEQVSAPVAGKNPGSQSYVQEFPLPDAVAFAHSGILPQAPRGIQVGQEVFQAPDIQVLPPVAGSNPGSQAYARVLFSAVEVFPDVSVASAHNGAALQLTIGAQVGQVPSH